jgi:hypothetical protein
MCDQNEFHDYPEDDGEDLGPGPESPVKSVTAVAAMPGSPDTNTLYLGY